MEKLKLYAIAIFAFKPDPEHTVSKRSDGSFTTSYQTRQGDEVSSFESTPGIGVSYDMAESEEAAKEAGVIKGKEMFPESEGYILHVANAVEINQEAIFDAVAAIEARSLVKSDEPERVM
jgi:hypothetical protein